MSLKVKCKKAINENGYRFKYGKIYDIQILDFFGNDISDIKNCRYIIMKDDNLNIIKFMYDTSFTREKFDIYFSFYDEQKVRDRKIKKVMKLIK